MKRQHSHLLPSSLASAALAILLLGGCDRRDDPDVDPDSTGTVNPPGETVDTDADDGGTDPVEPYDSTDATMPPPQNDPINPTSPPPVDPTDPTNQTPPPTDSNTRDSDNRDDVNH